MNSKPLIMIAVLGLVLSGCNKATQEVVRSVDWYKTNKSERLAKLEACKANPGELQQTPNCINAMEAERLSMSAGSTTRF